MRVEQHVLRLEVAVDQRLRPLVVGVRDVDGRQPRRDLLRPGEGRLQREVSAVLVSARDRGAQATLWRVPQHQYWQAIPAGQADEACRVDDGSVGPDVAPDQRLALEV